MIENEGATAASGTPASLGATPPRRPDSLGGQRRRREVTLIGVYDLDELDHVASLRRLLTIVATDALSLENSIARGRSSSQ